MGAFNQAMLDAIRGMNTRTATVDPNAPIPLPGQPTNTQVTGLVGSRFPADSYVNQDVTGFNAQQTIPGQSGGYAGIPMPGQPAYSMPQAQPLPGGTPMVPSGTGGGNGWGSRLHTRELISGLLAQMPPSSIPGPAPQSMPQQQQTSFMPNGMYGRQAMQLAGTYSPNTPPGDTYPNGLLGGKGAFRPGGK